MSALVVTSKRNNGWNDAMLRWKNEASISKKSTDVI